MGTPSARRDRENAGFRLQNGGSRGHRTQAKDARPDGGRLSRIGRVRFTDLWLAFRVLLIVLVILVIAGNSMTIERAWSGPLSSGVLPARVLWMLLGRRT
jgi:hypothetical protein